MSKSGTRVALTAVCRFVGPVSAVIATVAVEVRGRDTAAGVVASDLVVTTCYAVTTSSDSPDFYQCRINANRGPWQLFARGPLLTRDRDLSKL